jgi:hypothetical protein
MGLHYLRLRYIVVFHNRKSSLTSIVIGKMGLVEGYEALT